MSHRDNQNRQPVYRPIRCRWRKGGDETGSNPGSGCASGDCESNVTAFRGGKLCDVGEVVQMGFSEFVL